MVENNAKLFLSLYSSNAYETGFFYQNLNFDSQSLSKQKECQFRI